jgi:hypothetical protein
VSDQSDWDPSPVPPAAGCRRSVAAGHDTWGALGPALPPQSKSFRRASKHLTSGQLNRSCRSSRRRSVQCKQARALVDWACY